MRIGWTQSRGVYHWHGGRQRYTIKKAEDHLNSKAGVYRYTPYQNGIYIPGVSFPSLIAAQVWIENLEGGIT